MSAFTDYLAHRRQLAEARMRHERLMQAARFHREWALAMRWKTSWFEGQRKYKDAREMRAEVTRLYERAAEILREAKED